MLQGRGTYKMTMNTCSCHTYGMWSEGVECSVEVEDLNVSIHAKRKEKKRTNIRHILCKSLGDWVEIGHKKEILIPCLWLRCASKIVQQKQKVFLASLVMQLECMLGNVARAMINVYCMLSEYIMLLCFVTCLHLNTPHYCTTSRCRKQFKHWYCWRAWTICIHRPQCERSLGTTTLYTLQELWKNTCGSHISHHYRFSVVKKDGNHLWKASDITTIKWACCEHWTLPHLLWNKWDV